MRRYRQYLMAGEAFEMRLEEAQTVIIQGEIGSGGFGIVWRANHPQTTKEYAVKHINIPKLVDEGRIDRENKALLIRRIKREAKINVPSEYVVRCYGFREIRESYFLLSDYVPGDNLGFWLRFHAGASWTIKKAIYLNILQGVRALHQAGIVHRDLKPSNILLSSERKIPKIIDFGLIKLDDSADTMSGDFSGSQFYQDPALIQGMKGIKSGGRDSDVFALGILLYEMVMGKNPWHANNLRYHGIFDQIKGKDGSVINLLMTIVGTGSPRPFSGEATSPLHVYQPM